MVQQVEITLGIMFMALVASDGESHGVIVLGALLVLGLLLLVDWLQQRRLRRTVHRGQWGRDGQ